MTDLKHSNYCFTLNNYSDSQEDILKDFYSRDCRYLLYGHEVAPSTGTRHLQGYIQLKTRIRLSTVKSRLNKLSMGKYNQKLFDSIHLEPQRASDNEDARDYCKKEGDFIELGEFVQERSNAGKRMDLAQIVREYDDYFEALQLVKPHEIQYFKELWRNKPKKLINRDGVSLRPWQEFIFKKYIACKNDRDIVIVCDRVGNTGKTFFCNWLEDVWGAFITSPMKSQDILYAYNNEDIICFDYPRSKDDNFMFSGTIEVLKNGRGRAGKYEGRHIHRNTPASVILFTNSTTGIEIAEHFSNDRIILCYFDSFIYRKMKNDHPYYRYEIFTPQDLITPPSK